MPPLSAQDHAADIDFPLPRKLLAHRIDKLKPALVEAENGGIANCPWP
jgi:hypothetical protein